MSRSMECTVDHDRFRIERHDDGTTTIAHLRLGGEAGLACRKGKPVFQLLTAIEVPPALVDFLASALRGEAKPAFRLTPRRLAVLRDIAEDCHNGDNCSGACDSGWREGFMGDDLRTAKELAKANLVESANGERSDIAFHVNAAGRAALRSVP